jgi:hypothetical protein
MVAVKGFITGIVFDNKFTDTRARYIGFLRKTDAKIEYKAKAIESYKAYLKSGNADKFLEDNISLLEKTLLNDIKQTK